MQRLDIICDVGGSGTDWALVGEKQFEVFRSSPLNIKDGDFGDWLEETMAIAKRLKPKRISSWQIYIAGLVDQALGEELKSAIAKNTSLSLDMISINDDMLGACRAVYSGRPTIVGILGTGSNACTYNGEIYKIDSPSLGYILADDGGGADLGRRLLRAYFYNGLSGDLNRKLESDPFYITRNKVIEHVYRLPNPAYWLAGMVSFIKQHLDRPEISILLERAFDDFINTRIKTIPDHQTREIVMVGGIAGEFSTQLKAAFQKRGLSVLIPNQKIIDLLALRQIENKKASR